LIFHHQQGTEEPASCPPFQGEPLSSFFGFLIEKYFSSIVFLRKVIMRSASSLSCFPSSKIEQCNKPQRALSFAQSSLI